MDENNKKEQINGISEIAATENAETDNVDDELDRRIREFEDYLLSRNAPIPTEPSHKLADPNMQKEYAALAERKKTETVEFLRAAGVGKRKAVWLAEQFPDMPSDERTREAIRSAEELARGLERIKARMTDHSGHRERLRTSIKHDPELDAFSDIEILETLLSFFVPRKDTNPLAHELINSCGSLIGVVRTPTAALRKFRNMTEACARLLPMLSTVCLWDGANEIALRSPRDAVDFFGSLYHGGIQSGTYVAFLDGRFGLIAIERTSDKTLVSDREIIGSACKYSAKHVIVTARIDGFSERVFGLSAHAERLAKTLEMIGVDLLDFLLFSSRGYYSLGASKDESPKIFMFTPIEEMCTEPSFNRLIEDITDETD